MPGPVPTFSVDLIVKNIGKLPSPPAVIADLLRVIDDENISSVALANIIARDQATVVRILRIANSSFYGMSGKVDSLANAIAVLGLRTVRTLATGAAISGNLSSVVASGLDLKRFWHHGFATAVGARAIARRLNLGEGVAFVAGLLHDVGQLMLACSFTEHTKAIAKYRSENAVSQLEAEKSVLGMDHAAIGGVLIDRWHFPQIIVEAIANHHSPELLKASSLPFVIYVASELDLSLESREDPSATTQTLSLACWNELNLSPVDRQEILVEIERDLEPFAELMMG